MMRYIQFAVGAKEHGLATISMTVYKCSQLDWLHYMASYVLYLCLYTPLSLSNDWLSMSPLSCEPSVG